MAISFPNQRIIKIHREQPSRDFLGIKNDNWNAAARDLGAHATLLYLYLASNADNFSLILSPADIRQRIGMPTSTYRDQFVKLLDKGYLVQVGDGNIYNFYERPQERATHSLDVVPPTACENPNDTAATKEKSAIEHFKTGEVEEIYINIPTNREINKAATRESLSTNHTKFTF